MHRSCHDISSELCKAVTKLKHTWEHWNTKSLQTLAKCNASWTHKSPITSCTDAARSSPVNLENCFLDNKKQTTHHNIHTTWWVEQLCQMQGNVDPTALQNKMSCQLIQSAPQHLPKHGLICFFIQQIAPESDPGLQPVRLKHGWEVIWKGY